MTLFSKKKTPPPPVAPVTPPLLPKEDEPRTLKVDLPDVFAFEQDATKAKVAPRQPAPAEDEAAPVGTRGTVLLVESDDEVRRLLVRLLQHEGFNLQHATCLAEARELAKEQPVDFLLARRACVPLNLQTEIALRDLRAKTKIRIVDEFSDLMLGQVIDYESMSQYSLSLIDLLLSLLEGANAGARGHAHTVGKYCRLVGQRLGLTRRELDTLTLAAYIHDLGSLETAHKISEPVLGKKELLPPSLRSTLDLLANITFPYQINDLLSATSETTGPVANPPGVEPAAIPLGARVLRVVDTYDTLRRNNRAEFPEEDALFDWMRRQPTGVFDLDVLETFIHIRKHERAISAMNIFWVGVLLVDPHPEDLQLLRLRLENDDFHVLVARTVEEALQQLRSNDITLVLTEYHLDTPTGGAELLRAIKADPTLQRIPVVFHAAGDTDLIKQALEQGAEDWYAKPHNIEITAMKLQRIIHRVHASPAGATEGVRGSLRDMGLIEMVQILSTGSRSVRIQLDHGDQQAELVLRQGDLISATLGHLTGEAAALAILGWHEGQFRILPFKQALPVTITTSTDNLLLQSCRRDLASKPAEPPTPGAANA